jgi:hypothetical protein
MTSFARRLSLGRPDDKLRETRRSEQIFAVDDAERRHGKGEQIERKMIIAAMRKDRKQKISEAWSELARC